MLLFSFTVTPGGVTCDLRRFGSRRRSQTGCILNFLWKRSSRWWESNLRHLLVFNSSLVPQKYHIFAEVSTSPRMSPSFCQQVQQQESGSLSHGAHGSVRARAHLFPQRYHKTRGFSVVRRCACISVHPDSPAWSRSASVPCCIKRTCHHPEHIECSMGQEDEGEEKKMEKPRS